jgi:GxxExxY protein
MSLLYEETTGKIIGAYYKVHKDLVTRAGYSQENYVKALVIEMHQRGLKVREQYFVHRKYQGRSVGGDFIDLLVNDKVIVEIIKCSRITNTHKAKCKTYFIDSGMAVGLLLRFGGEEVEFERVYVHENDPEAK